jgi:hypothetical protein
VAAISPGLVTDAVVVNNNAYCLAAAAEVSFQSLPPRSLFVILGWLDGNVEELAHGCDVYEFIEYLLRWVSRLEEGWH